MNPPTSDPKTLLKQKALRLLARREHSTYELIQKLKSVSSDHHLIETILHDLQQKKIQSDERFTESFIHHRMQQGYGYLKILYELREKKISDDLISKYLSRDENIWREVLQKLYQKRYGEKKLSQENYQTCLRFFLNRGFKAEWIHVVFKMESV